MTAPRWLCGWGYPFTGSTSSIPRSWSVAPSTKKKAPKNEDVFDPNFCTYRGVRWSRPMLKFIVEEVGVPSNRISQFAETAIVNLNVTTNLRPKVSHLTSALNLTRTQVGALVGAFPGVLGLSVAKNIDPTLEFLASSIPLPRDRLGRVVQAYPQLLGLSVSANLTPKLRFFVEELRVPAASLARVVERHPSVLGLSLPLHLRPLLAFLRSDLALSPDDVGRVVVACPMLLSCSLDNNLKPSAAYFSTLLSLSSAELGPVLCRYPPLLVLNLDRTVQPKVDLLRKLKLSRPAIATILAKNPAILGVSLERHQTVWHRLLTDGLSPTEARKVLKAHPRVLTHSTAERVRSVFALLASSLHLSPAGARRAVVADPQLLTIKLSPANASKVIKTLHAEGGLAQADALKLLRRRPAVLAVPVGARLQPLLRLFRERLHMSPAQVRRALERNPWLLGISLDALILPRLHFLRDQVGVPEEQLGLVVARAPSLLALSVPRSLRPALACLRLTLRVPDDKIPQMVVRAPSLLASRPETLQLVYDFFLYEVGVDQRRLPFLVASQPQILMSSLEGKLRPCLDFLSLSLLLSPPQVRKVVASHPSILCLNPANLIEKVQLLEQELGVPRAVVGGMVVAFPALLTLSADSNLRPKLHFLLHEKNVPRSVLAGSPQLLAYSLANRIKPRFDAIQACGKEGTVTLSSMLAPNDEAFQRRFGPPTALGSQGRGRRAAA